MSPDEINSTPENTSLPPQRSIDPTPARLSTQQAAAQVVRTQIDTIYDTNPYDRTHAANPQPELDQWKQYHSAWQTYYQKYYEGYYTHHLNKATEGLQTNTTEHARYFTHQPQEPTEEILSKEEALFDLRQKLLSRVNDSAKKVRKSRHFIPITAGIVVVLLFAFLQYNQLLIANVMAYVSPGSIDPQNIVIDPATDINVSPDPRLIIPKINVDVPVRYDVGTDYASQMKAMETGVAHFPISGANSHPGQIGNTVIAGHSSNDIFEVGDYKFIFAQLEKLTVGDTIYANFEGKRYTYTVTGTEVVKPSEVSKLVYPSDKPVMTLITCTPLGTALNRLLVTATQVNPDPAASSPAPASESGSASTAIPGSSPTLIERLFGG